jgi:carboxyl-terminal processing protease
MTKARLLVVCLFAAGAAAAAAPLVTAFAMQREDGAVADLGLLAGVIQVVHRDYVHPVGSDELTKDALKGMLNRLDPHSDYMDEQEFKQSQAGHRQPEPQRERAHQGTRARPA